SNGTALSQATRTAGVRRSGPTRATGGRSSRAPSVSGLARPNTQATGSTTRCGAGGSVCRGGDHRRGRSRPTARRRNGRISVLESADFAENWSRLDDFEGPGYQRVLALVRTSAGDIEAFIYVVRD